MKISQSELKRIIVEEYIKEEGLEESQAAQDLLRQILGDEEYERRQALKNQGSRGGDTKPMEKPNKASETMPIDSPETASAPHPVKAAVDGIYELVADMDPEDVAEIFQIVFEKLPGVELEPQDVNPGTLYSPGAEGRPQISLGPLREEVFQKIVEMGSYGLRSMAGIPGARDEEDEVPEPEETDNIMMNIGNINAYYEKTGKTPSWAKAGLEAMEKRIAAARANAGKYGSVSKHLEEDV
tara:strand:- start:7797 stop:8516 length:720 start_codon:yes stop_codon:yes gene_type:complete